jgi:hypothetical protein
MNAARRVLLVALVGAALLLALLPAAEADRLRRSDARGDVGVADDGGDPVPAPRRRDPDVRRASLAHHNHAMVLRLRFRDILPEKRRWLGAFIETPGDESYSVTVRWRRSGTFTVSIEHSPDVVWCPLLAAAVDTDRDVVRLRIPRRCLGSPRWMRVGILIERPVRDGLWASDDPLRDGTTGTSAMSRRLFRG